MLKIGRRSCSAVYNFVVFNRIIFRLAVRCRTFL